MAAEVNEVSQLGSTSWLSRMPLKVKLKLAYARVLGIKRGEYKRVWDRISIDESAAMVGVSGCAERQEFFASGEATAAAIKEMLGVTTSDDVLEIGCGVGRVGKTLAPECRSWTGVDISAEMIRYARANLAELPNARLLELSASTLTEIKSESMDCVYCTAVFMHLDEWERYKYVAEAFRVLRPGGRAYFDNLNLGGDIGWNIFLEMSKFEPELRPPNISKSSTAEELAIYLERASFADVQKFPGAHFVAATGVKR